MRKSPGLHSSRYQKPGCRLLGVQAFTGLRMLLGCVLVACCTASLIFLLRLYAERRSCDAFVAEVSDYAQALRSASARSKAGTLKPGPEPTRIPAEVSTILREKRSGKFTALGGNFYWEPAQAPTPQAEEKEKETGPRVLGRLSLHAFRPSPAFSMNSRQLSYLKERFSEKRVPGVVLESGFNGWPRCIISELP